MQSQSCSERLFCLHFVSATLTNDKYLLGVGGGGGGRLFGGAGRGVLGWGRHLDGGGCGELAGPGPGLDVNSGSGPQGPGSTADVDSCSEGNDIAVGEVYLKQRKKCFIDSTTTCAQPLHLPIACADMIEMSMKHFVRFSRFIQLVSIIHNSGGNGPLYDYGTLYTLCI